MGVIYRITSPTGRVYVGKTVNMKRRISDYKYKLNGRSSIVINSIKKYGWANHKFEVIEDNVAEEMLDEREMYWILELKTYYYHYPLGMNQTLGGDGQRTTWMHDTERRKEQSDRFSGNGNPFFGKTHSDENKRKSSIRVSEYNKKNGVKVPEWGADKGHEIRREIVLCYDKNGDFVKEYESLTAAAIGIGSDHGSVSLVCNGKRTHAAGFIFKYKTENYPLKIEVGELKQRTEKKAVICQYKNKTMKFTSPEEASKETGIPVTTIRRAAAYRNGKPIRTGHIFKYKT